MDTDMTSNSGPIECGLCGVSLGTGNVGGFVHCWKCGEYVVANARRGSSDAIGGLLAIGIGLAFVAIIAAVFSGD